MKKGIFRTLLSLVLVFCMAMPSSFLTATAADSYVVVDDTVTDSSLDHYFTYTEATDANGLNGWASDTKSSISTAGVTNSAGADVAQTQHWVWNTNYSEAAKHTYTFTFKGTGVEIIGVKNDAQNTFQLDNNAAETVTITGAANTPVTLYSKTGLTYGTHTVSATLPEGGTGLQVCFAKVYGAEQTSVVYEYEKVSVVNPTSNSWHVTDKDSGDGSAAWAFDGEDATRWHSNYTADVTENGVVTNKHSSNLTWGTVNEIPAFSEVSSSRAWIGAEFTNAVNIGKLTYAGRRDASKNWIGQYALYVANVANGAAVTDADYICVANGTTAGYSPMTIQLDTPVTATHFRLVAFSSSGGGNFATASEIEVYEAIVPDMTPVFGGAIVDTDTQWTQNRLGEVKRLTTTSKALTAWKNDKATSEIALYAAFADYDNVTVTVGDLSDGNGNVISADNVTTTFVRSTKAYNGDYLGYGSPDRVIPADNGSNRSESSDILWTSEPVNMSANSVQPVWVEIAVPEDAEAGVYTGTISATADGVTDALEFTYTVEVYDAVLPDAEDYTFNIMQWQYPYSSAEYYGVEPFSAKHLEILKEIMGVYKEVGGKAITTTFTEEAWAGQTYSANPVHYPSMVKWTKNTDGSFSYDYTHFDKWVSLCKEIGLGEKIVAYGIAPWHSSFTYWTEGASAYTKEGYSVGNARYVAVWTDFLTNFAAHLEEKGWKDQVYIGIDERGVSAAAFDVAEAAGFKTAADIDNINNHWEIAQRVTDLNVGDTAAYKLSAQFAELKEIRDAKGFTTTLYSCTEHRPGNFSLSAPVESYWTVLNAGMMDADGFNRWAYDAWVADPLNDATHNSFEPGDCFVIYPDEKTAANPRTRYSVRLARMAEGIRDINKLAYIESEVPALASDVDAVYENIQYALVTSRAYLSASAVSELSEETAAFKADLNDLTEKYVAIKNGELSGIFGLPTDVEIEFGDTYQLNPQVISDKEDKSLDYTSEDEKIATVDENGVITAVGRGTTIIKVKNEAGGYEEEIVVTVSVEISLLNKLRKFELPEAYQSDVEGPYPAGHARRYMGQPDMVQTETGRLITVFPTGHGHGPLIMKISEDGGETWTEKTDIPSSWAASQETPTIYSLQIEDETEEDGYRERLVLVCACPNWDLNLGGWQMSYSDDNGDKWTEFEDFWQTVDGNKHWTIVAMASLVQLKDEDGNWKQEWMGVYHDYDYINYKTILTFDENGNPQWSKPEKYLSEYRAIESSHQICEVGMFRSPDGNRIVGLGRNQTHSGPATMFYSDDEGKTWSEPVELPGSLAGERHKAMYDPESGKLLITYREIDYDRNKDGTPLSTSSDWIAGEWVAWVGTYDQLMNLQQGEYMLILDKDFSGNAFSGDTGYTGMALLEDGSFVLHSYGHWDQASSSVSDVRTDLCWIRQAKFKLAEIEEELKVDEIPEPELEPSDASRDIPISAMTATTGSYYGDDGGQNIDKALDGVTSTIWHTDWKNDKDNRDNHWIAFELDEVYAVDGVRYLNRQDGAAGCILGFKVQVSADGNNWTDVVSGGTFENSTAWQRESFKPVETKYVRIKVEASTTDNSGAKFAAAAEIRLTGEIPVPVDPEPDVPVVPSTPVAEKFKDVKEDDWFVDAVQYVYDNGIMGGSGQYFKPSEAITREQVVATLFNMEADKTVTDYTAVDELKDLKAGQWYTDAVCWAYNVGVAQGNSTTKLFSIGKPITREQLAVMLYNYSVVKGYDVSVSADYSGLKGANEVSDYATGYMSWAYGAGLIGGNGNLNPKGNTTRAQMASMMMQFVENVAQK